MNFTAIAPHVEKLKLLVIRQASFDRQQITNSIRHLTPKF
jgi:hypothetical protein